MFRAGQTVTYPHYGQTKIGVIHLVSDDGKTLVLTDGGWLHTISATLVPYPLIRGKLLGAVKKMKANPKVMAPDAVAVFNVFEDKTMPVNPIFVGKYATWKRSIHRISRKNHGVLYRVIVHLNKKGVDQSFVPEDLPVL